MKGKIIIIIFFLIIFFGCTFHRMFGDLRPAPNEFIDFAQQVMDSSAYYRDLLLNSKFEKTKYSTSEEGISTDSILITRFKKECGENFKVDKDQSYIHYVRTNDNRIDTVCIVMFSCKNKKYKGDNQWQILQSFPEYIMFGPRWDKRNGSWVFDGFGFIPGVN